MCSGSPNANHEESNVIPADHLKGCWSTVLFLDWTSSASVMYNVSRILLDRVYVYCYALAHSVVNVLTFVRPSSGSACRY